MTNCIFCKIVQKEIPSWQVYETDQILAFFDINPINKYHTLVIPKKHYLDIFATPESVLQEIMSVIKNITVLYQQKLDLQNVQILNNSGVQAQQDVLHLHFHIIPRYKGDKQNITRADNINYKKINFKDLLTKIS